MDTIVLEYDKLAELVRVAIESENNNKIEVWDGEWVVSPDPNDEHQELVMNLSGIFWMVIGWAGGASVRPGVNVSDRVEQWEHSFRSPDVVVYLSGTTARNLGTHRVGGPDFAVEIVSRGDRSRKKLDFYAKVGTRELLVVDRNSWVLELYRFDEEVLKLVGKSNLDRPDVLISGVLPLSFRLVAGEDRPKIEVAHSDGVQRWSA